MLPRTVAWPSRLKPSPDSHIEVEVWLPADWNGKFQAVGNGGVGRHHQLSAMATALQEGYATASTDTGHKGGNASFAIGHPEKFVDFAYRAVHEMTVQVEGAHRRVLRPRRRGCRTGTAARPADARG